MDVASTCGVTAEGDEEDDEGGDEPASIMVDPH